ncbi:MAG: sulfotransferase family 2 domain-containing protein [Roseivirga sp.]
MKVFIHIPKTAGTSVCSLLNDSIFFKKFCRLNPTRFTHPKDFLSGVEDQLQEVINSGRYKCVGGHFGFGAHPKLTNPQDYFVMLREPVDRVVSEYYYMFQQGFYYKELIDSEKLTLSGYLHHPETMYLNNLQTRLISGVSYDLGDQVTEEMYLLAVENLKRFAAVGLTEHFYESVGLYHIKMNWPRTPLSKFANQNNLRPAMDKIDESELEKVREREKYDLALYREAEKIFDEELKRNRTAVDEVISSMKSLPPLYRQRLKVMKAGSKVKHELSVRVFGNK